MELECVWQSMVTFSVVNNFHPIHILTFIYVAQTDSDDDHDHELMDDD